MQWTELDYTDLPEVNKLQRERDALLTGVGRLLSHYTNRPHCGHDFTCVCKDNDIAALRALWRKIEGPQ